jgi:hypothetical protein
MAKHLNDKDIVDIIDILDDWPTDSKLTLDKFVEAVEDECKFKTTRQTLMKQSRIKTAYDEVKGIVSGQTTANKPKLPPSLKIAGERLEKKNRKIARLERENEQLLEQFQVWLYNASINNVSIEQLSEPLPSKDNQ